MKFLKEFKKMKVEFNEAEKVNKLRREEHIRRFEELKAEYEEQSAKVEQRLHHFQNK